MGIKSTQRGGNGAGRGDAPYGLTDKVYAYSASTRNADPSTDADLPSTAKGSQASFRVMNNATSAQGTTMGNVRSTYKAARQGGMSPDAARGVAVTGAGNYGPGAGGNAQLATDYKGNPVP